MKNKTISSIRVTEGLHIWAFGPSSGPVGSSGFSKPDSTIPELQMSLLELWAEHAAKLGYNPDGLVCELSATDRWRIIRREDKWAVDPA